MFSRRSFLLASMGLLGYPYSVFGKKRHAEVKAAGPHTLSREEWPPAIQPDFLSITDKGFALLSDESGRLAIVNFKREQGPLVIGEVTGIAKKILGMAVTQHRAYAIGTIDVQGESQYILATISIQPPNDPTVFSRTPLGYFTEPTAIAAAGELVAVGGTSLNGDNQVVFFPANQKHPSGEAMEPVSTIRVDSTVTRLDLQDRQLIVLQAGGRATQVDVYSMGNPRIPEKIATLRLDGNYAAMSRVHEALAVAGQSNDRKFDVKVIALKPNVHVVSRSALPLTEVMDVVMQKGQILVLGNQINRQAVIPITINPKNLSMAASAAVVLPAGTRGAASKARIAVSGKDAYVASDWGGVQVLNIDKDGWKYLYSHTIPRLPAAAIAVAGQRAVLGGVDLKVYNIAEPQHPQLVDSAELGAAVRAVAVTGDYILALTRDTLSLRLIDKPSNVVSSLKINGQGLAYDSVQRRAYVVAGKEKTTVITPVRVINGVAAERATEANGVYQHAAADNGKLILCGINKLALFTQSSDSLQQTGSRDFPNLAFRDAYITDETAVITAVDANSKGYLLLIDASKPDLNTIGSIDLPQDAVALAVSGKQAVVVGRAQSGKDIASIIDLSNPTSPKIVDSFPVLEAASAVAIRDRLALVAGRGLQILSLS